ncbi:cell division protein FtsW (lipid II flippase) [Sporomusaceae bacterium BoRhaA]|uniref:FtsW/RodA/SpoVE family cell cycle protein n=1 Tax=Pelorhabdus rhamnosifermentans TaxID=2772457 RepID=UPI001C060785|nr:FtsW/RodA/SpoVE family cell cycle protein [Pelorhabdus rhamnosifermentans]MBU2700255.1 cell division protein FtsW (lipid II flippase) [Pelorhabdus rhamnosifermentans]
MTTLCSRQERWLFFIASVIFVNGLLAVSLARGVIDVKALAIALAIIVLGAVVHLVIRKMNPVGDPFLFPCSFVLAAIGLIMIYRLKPALFELQALWTSLGLLVFTVSTYYFRKLEKLADYKYVLGIIGIGLLLAAVLFGVDIGGHKSWIVLGPIRFQPSEFAKIFVVLFLAGYLDENSELLRFATKRYAFLEIPEFRFLAPIIFLWILTSVMYVVQRDFGSALLYFGTVIIMVYMGSGKASFLAIGSLLFLCGSAVSYKFYSHIQTRVDIWLNPWSDPSGRAFQIVQSLFALGSGGLLGSGLTYGFPELIPEVHTDFIFAAIGEELGFAGATAVMLLYIFLIYRAFRTSLQAPTPYLMLVAGGLATVLSLQVFLIVGGVIKFFPLTGIPLPWISYGGSAIVSNFILLAMLYSVSGRRSAYE